MTYPIVEALELAIEEGAGDLAINCARTIEALAAVLVKALEFVEEMEARNDTHYLIGGEIYTALSNLRARGEEVGNG